MNNSITIIFYCALALLIGPISVYVPMIRYVNPILLILLWELFHPTAFPLLMLVMWLILAQLLIPLMPWGSVILLGLVVTELFKRIQRNYLEHRRLSTFIVLIAATSVCWDAATYGITAAWSMMLGAPPLWVGWALVQKTILLDATGIVIGMLILVTIESRFYHETMTDTLRRYYEHLHRPHFRSSHTTTA